MWEPWVSGPRLKLWRLIVPWKPLPTETAETFTFSPGSKLATVTSSPTLVSEEASSLPSPSASLSVDPLEPPSSTSRNSTSLFIPAAPAFFRWPASALVIRSASIGRAAS